MGVGEEFVITEELEDVFGSLIRWDGCTRSLDATELVVVEVENGGVLVHR